MSAVCFVQPLAETALAPVEKQITRDLDIEEPYQWMLVNSLILVGIGVSSLLFAPLSEVYGRKPVLLAGSISFVVWNTGCGSVSKLYQMFALRLLSGFGASVGDSILSGVIGDLWQAKNRGKGYSMAMFAPLLATALGPICGAFISEGANNWRWVFWMTSIASVGAIAIAIVFLRETYEPRCVRDLRREARAALEGKPRGRLAQWLSGKTPTKAPEDVALFIEVMCVNLQRPFRMLGTQSKQSWRDLSLLPPAPPFSPSPSLHYLEKAKANPERDSYRATVGRVHGHPIRHYVAVPLHVPATVDGPVRARHHDCQSELYLIRTRACGWNLDRRPPD